MFFTDLNVHYIGRYVPANERGRCRPVLGAPFRHHALPQDLVDPREMAFAFRAEPVEDVGVNADGGQFLDWPEERVLKRFGGSNGNRPCRRLNTASLRSRLGNRLLISEHLPN